jgi:hypothetical protein
MQDDWHLVEARRDDGSPALFRIRELAVRHELPTIFVVEMPFHSTEMSELPNAAQYRRSDQFRDEWLLPACAALGWEYVALKIEDGAIFFYLYGSGDPDALIERFTPFDPDLSFYDDADPLWAEYAYLRELLDEAMQLPHAPRPKPEPAPRPAPKARAPKAKKKASAPATAKAKAKAKTKQTKPIKKKR